MLKEERQRPGRGLACVRVHGILFIWYVQGKPSLFHRAEIIDSNVLNLQYTTYWYSGCPGPGTDYRDWLTRYFEEVLRWTVEACRVCAQWRRVQ